MLVFGWIDQLISSNKLHFLFLFGLIDEIDEMLLFDSIIIVPMFKFYIFFSLPEPLKLVLQVDLILARSHHLQSVSNQIFLNDMIQRSVS